MRKKYSLLGWKAMALLLLTGAFSVLDTDDAFGQYPDLPILKLISENETFLGNGTVHPDLRMWVPRSEDGKPPREILVPILIKNCWESVDEIVTVEPIKSFTIKMQYDGRALRAIGLQKVGPNSDDVFSLAKNFRLDWDDIEDPTYKASLGSLPEPEGRRIRITGVTSDQLPLSPAPEGLPNPTCRDREYAELFYIRFQVLAQPATVSDNSPLIITNDTLIWNDRWVTEKQFDPQPLPDEFAGLDGINNSNNDEFNNNEATRPGVIYLNVTEVPILGFAPTEGANAVVEEVDGTDLAEWQLIDPITLDSSATDHGAQENKARRRVDVINLVPSTRLTNIRVESDQPWLKFVTPAGLPKRPIPREASVGTIDFIDRILGDGHRNPLGIPTDADATLVMEIICDADQLVATESPAGIYVGYITFTSESALISPVRLKVTFIMFRNPIEPNEETDTRSQFVTGRGIELVIENSNNPIERSTMIFGTGVRATDGVDLLFGETRQQNPQSGFGARWYPKDQDGNDLVPNGLGDLTGRSNSIDVRDALEEDRTIAYTARFNAGGADNYPVTLTWDVRDFPDGAQLFLRDTINGGIFATNMREATRVPGEQTLLTFTIEDARINSFLIEYTPPKRVRIPNLNSGWNLVSLPVRPGDGFYRNVYANALEAPQFYSADLYRTEPDGELRFGVGYFVKYGAVLDESIAGVTVLQVGPGTRYQVRVEDGWNTIGALSVPIDVDQIEFRSFQGQPVPERVGGVYEYVTNQGYREVSELLPGFGYWIAIQAADPNDLGVGILTMDATNAKSSATSRADVREYVLDNSVAVSINDAAQRSGKVFIAPNSLNVNMQRFNLPPVMHNDMFDVRFSSDRYVDDVQDPFIVISGATYPVEVAVDDAYGHYTVYNAQTGAEIGFTSKAQPLIIGDESVDAIKLEKSGSFAAGFSLQQNTPNPANGLTAINFTLDQKSFVTVSIYNALGTEVATLGNAEFEAGAHVLNFDSSNLPTGSYIYTLSAGDKTATRTMTIVK